MVALQILRNLDESEAFAPGQTIFTMGDSGDVMYVVGEGEVDLFVNGRHVETVLPGGMLGEMALIEHKPRSATAVAKTSARLVPVSEKRFNFLVQNTPHFALQVMRVMAERLRRADTQL